MPFALRNDDQNSATPVIASDVATNVVVTLSRQTRLAGATTSTFGTTFNRYR